MNPDKINKKFAFNELVSNVMMLLKEIYILPIHRPEMKIKVTEVIKMILK